MLGTGAVALVPAYRGYAAALVLLVAAVLPVLVVALGARLRLPTWSVAVGATSLVLLPAVALVGRGHAEPFPTPAWRASPLGAQVAPLLDSVAGLLTAPRPAPADAVHLAPTAVLVALVALVVALLSERGALAGTAPLLGAALLQGAGALLTAGGPDRAAVLAALLVAVVAIGWVGLDGRDGPAVVAPVARLGAAPGRRALRWSRATPVTAVVLLTAASVAVLGPLVVHGAPFEPRDHVQPPTQQVDVDHVLTQAAVWSADPDRELLQVRGDVPERLSLAVLPDFDGATWRGAVALREVGTVVSPALPPAARSARMDAEVVLTGLADDSAGGSWLPSAGRLVSISVPGARWDVDTGAVLAPDRPVHGTGYRVVAEVDVPSAADVRRAGVLSGPEAERFLELPRLPADVRAYARDVTRDAGSRLEQAVAIQEAVRGERTLSPEAFSGSSYARVREFLFAAADDGGQVGSAEQFAASYAVLARAAGLPTRLVVGFRVPSPGVDGVRTVRGEDAHVWPEVHLAGAGWVVVDPSPSEQGDVVGQEAGTTDLGGADDPVGPDDEPAPLPSPSAAPAPDGAAGGDDGSGGGAWGTALVGLTVVLGTFAMVLAVLVVLAVLRGRRTARQRRGGAVGAWQHLEDALVLAGRPPAAAAGADEVARAVGGVAAGRLAVAAEAAGFGPPGGTEPSDAWTDARHVVRDVRRGAPAARRLRWAVDPAPLRRRPG